MEEDAAGPPDREGLEAAWRSVWRRRGWRGRSGQTRFSTASDFALWGGVVPLFKKALDPWTDEAGAQSP